MTVPYKTLVATCQTWPSTTALPSLLAAAGSRVTAFSPGPLGLSRYVDERIKGPRNPIAAALELRALVAARTFDWVIVADEALLGALVKTSLNDTPSSWLPFDPRDADAAGTLLSKYAFAGRAPSLGIATPESSVCASPHECVTAARTIGFPVVVKGEFGFAGLEVNLVRDEPALRRLAGSVIARYGRALVQRYIEGRQVSVAALYAHGEPLGYKTYLAQCCYPTADSQSTLHRAFDHPSLETVVRAIGAATSFHGLAGIDFMYEEKTGKLYALEVNPRPTLAVAGDAEDRAFFADLVQRFLRGERSDTITFRSKRPEQAYFPGHLFYFMQRADKRDPRSYRRLISSLRTFDSTEWRLAAWESARFAYDQATKRLPGVRSLIDAVRRANWPAGVQRDRAGHKEDALSALPTLNLEADDALLGCHLRSSFTQSESDFSSPQEAKSAEWQPHFSDERRSSGTKAPSDCKAISETAH